MQPARPRSKTPPALRLGGVGGEPAITWHGTTISYDGLARLVAAAPSSACADLSGMELPQAMAAAFAAAARETAVFVAESATPAQIGPPPSGAWLLATTSGTSGRPRTIWRSAASWAASVRPLAEAADVGPGETVGWTGPLHSTLHLHAAVHALAIGAHLTDDLARATVLHCVPTVLADLLRAPDRAPRLRTAIVAGAGLPEGLAAEAAARGIGGVEYYGAAELSFVGIRRWPEPLLRPFPGVTVRLGNDGVLWAASQYLAGGYVPAAGANAGPAAGAGSVSGAGVGSAEGGPLRRDADGFATVGDLAHAPSGDPSDGFVIRGRGSSAILVGGFTVLAEDVEATLESLPGVRAAAVIGVPHARLGHTLVAVVELTDPHIDGSSPADLSPALRQVQQSARALLHGAHRPHRYLAVARLPRTGAGKIARAAVTELVHDALT